MSRSSVQIRPLAPTPERPSRHRGGRFCVRAALRLRARDLAGPGTFREGRRGAARNGAVGCGQTWPSPGLSAPADLGARVDALEAAALGGSPNDGRAAFAALVPTYRPDKAAAVGSGRAGGDGAATTWAPTFLVWNAASLTAPVAFA